MTAGEFVSNCTADALISAAKLLKAGGLVALPTETVYGLGADATNKDAVARIYKVKGRPADHPLIVHIHSCLLYTSPSPRDRTRSRMPSSA